MDTTIQTHVTSKRRSVLYGEDKNGGSDKSRELPVNTGVVSHGIEKKSKKRECQRSPLKVLEARIRSNKKGNQKVRASELIVSDLNARICSLGGIRAKKVGKGVTRPQAG